MSNERIVGPVQGCWLALYAVQQPDGWMGYAKICLGGDRPDDVWSCPASFKVAGGLAATAENALGYAEARAVMAVSLAESLAASAAH